MMLDILYHKISSIIQTLDMKKNRLPLRKLMIIFISLIVVSCNSSRNDKDIMKLLYLSKGDLITKDKTVYGKFFNTLISSASGHICSREMPSGNVYAALNVSNDSVIVFEPSKNERKAILLPFKTQLPISLVYYHNRDSIFIFLDRFYIRGKHIPFANKLSDFYLINSVGKLINSYSLDFVPNIDNPKDSNRLFLNKRMITQNMIIKNKIFLPFYIFIPKNEYSKDKIKLMCEFDLSNASFRMLDIFIESTNYIENTDWSPLMMLNFNILNDSELLYSFNHTPLIYKYNLKSDKSERINTLKDFPYYTHKDSLTKIEYGNLKYALNDSIFYRTVSFDQIKSQKNSIIKEFFNDSFEYLGFTMQNMTDMPIFNRHGSLVMSLMNGARERSIYHTYPHFKKKISLEQFDSIIFPKESKPKITYPSIVFNEPFVVRLYNYAKSLNIEKNSRLVFINFDHSCSSTLDYLFDFINKYEGILSSKNVKFIVYSEDPKKLLIFSSQNKSIMRFFILDKDMKIFNYISYSEVQLQYMFILGNKKLEYLTEYNCNTTKSNFDNLLEY